MRTRERLALTWVHTRLSSRAPYRLMLKLRYKGNVNTRELKQRMQEGTGVSRGTEQSNSAMGTGLPRLEE